MNFEQDERVVVIECYTSRLNTGQIVYFANYDGTSDFKHRAYSSQEENNELAAGGWLCNVRKLTPLEEVLS